jgi:hypothetical protein
MGPRPIIPQELKEGPFNLVEARSAGLTRRQLQGTSWRRISVEQYAWAGLRDALELILAAVHSRLPAEAAFSGGTAAWLHGLDTSPCDPVEAVVPDGCGVSARAGIAVSRANLAQGEVVVRRGLPTTSALSTVFDLGSRLPLIEAVVAVDMALKDGLVALPDLHRWTAEHCRSKGIRQFRRVVELAEPLAESAMETRLRLLLVQAGLPQPQAQVPLRDDHGRFLGRADLYYPTHRLALEYDGRSAPQPLQQEPGG